MKLHTLDSFESDGFYTRNVYSLEEKNKEAKELKQINTTPGKLLYHYDIKKHSFLKEKIKELEEIYQ